MYRVHCTWYRVHCTGCRVGGAEYRVVDGGYRVEGGGYRGEGTGREGEGCRVWVTVPSWVPGCWFVSGAPTILADHAVGSVGTWPEGSCPSHIAQKQV